MNTDYLYKWDAKAEQRKAEFMEHCYRCSARTNGLYTGLWKEFCLKEAGPYCRNLFFERQEAIKKFIEEQKTTLVESNACEPEPFITEFHD